MTMDFDPPSTCSNRMISFKSDFLIIFSSTHFFVSKAPSFLRRVVVLQLKDKLEIG